MRFAMEADKEQRGTTFSGLSDSLPMVSKTGHGAREGAPQLKDPLDFQGPKFGS